jgi:hypothetical protein
MTMTWHLKNNHGDDWGSTSRKLQGDAFCTKIESIEMHRNAASS